ncbi:MAG: tyrosine--tRNA ligase [Phycisphaerales bacterium]|nr:tyrosine--tRNA ligase [Phycisphaerales bacterium]
MSDPFLQEMAWRGLIHQATHEPELDKHLSTGHRRAYVGFDPTANSLTIGNLMGIMTLRRFQEAGHQPVVVMGGGTGLIGDPSGKSAERMLMTKETVDGNVQSQRRIFEALLDFSPARSNRAMLANNIDWLGKLSYLDALRDIGKFFSVNAMIQRDSVRDRLNNREQGISYTEFSYMILQSYDYYHLWKEQGVTLQMGGSDQWGNIVSGADLIKRDRDQSRGLQSAVGVPPHGTRPPAQAGGSDPHSGPDQPLAFALTWPLVTKSDGTKFGKTESGAIWLTADRTSPYEYYQFWLNTPDADAVKFLKFFTLLPQGKIADLEASLTTDPAARQAQRTLAHEATSLLHGKAEADNAESAAKALFSGDIAHLPEATVRQVLANVPASKHARSRLDGAGIPILDLLIDTKLASSKREAREFLSSGSVAINGRKAGVDESVKTTDLMHGRLLAIRRGKKNWHLTEWE